MSKEIFIFFGKKRYFQRKTFFFLCEKKKTGKASRKNLIFRGYFRHDISV